MSRYRVSANLIWDVEADTTEESRRAVAQTLKQIVESAKSIIHIKGSGFSINKLADKKQQQTSRLAEFSPKEVLDRLTAGNKVFAVDDKTYEVKSNSHRMKCFARSLQCVFCGIEGVKMVLEFSTNSHRPHFNLYAIEDGEEVLMTKDHILPKSNGGKDAHDNYQTACSPCNFLRGADEFTREEILYLRGLHNQHHRKPDWGKMLKKEQSKLRSSRQMAS